MIKITIIAVGKLKEKYLCDACAEYLKRLTSCCKTEIIEISETRCPDSPSDAEISEVIRSEGARILEKLPKRSYNISMCIEGKQLDSVAFADKIESISSSLSGHITFIIGGSYGLSDEVKSRADLKMSMSEMTFPHMLARVMLLEQIYRAFQIKLGKTYHK